MMTIDEAIEIYMNKYRRILKEKDELVKERDYHHAHELVIKMADYYEFIHILEDIKNGSF